MHIAMRMAFDASATVKEIQGVLDHLGDHLREQIPEVEVYIHPEVGQG